MSVERLRQELEGRFQSIWKSPPSELENLKDPRGPHCQSFTMLLNAYMQVFVLAETLWTFRQQAKAGRKVQSLVDPLIAMLENIVPFLALFGLTDTSDLLHQTAEVLPMVQKTEDFVFITEKLAMYLNRLGANGWMDLMIPFRKISYIYESVLK
jgi:hypothetical protein